jgi:hypothetical protein
MDQLQLDAEVHAAIADYISSRFHAAAKALISRRTQQPRIYPRSGAGEAQVKIYLGEEMRALYEQALTRLLAA